MAQAQPFVRINEPGRHHGVHNPPPQNPQGGRGPAGPQQIPHPHQQPPMMGPHMPGPPRDTLPPDLRQGRPVEISDVSEDLLSDVDMRNRLMEYVGFRFEKMPQQNPYNEFGDLQLPTWDKAVRTQVKDMSQKQFAREIRHLNQTSLPVVEKKRGLNTALQRQIDKAQEWLMAHEGPLDLMNYQWVLAQASHQLREIQPPVVARGKMYPGTRTSKSNSGRKRTVYVSGNHKKRRYERISLTAYFRREPRENVDIRALWEAKRIKSMANNNNNNNSNNAPWGAYPGQMPRQAAGMPGPAGQQPNRGPTGPPMPGHMGQPGGGRGNGNGPPPPNPVRAPGPGPRGGPPAPPGVQFVPQARGQVPNGRQNDGRQNVRNRRDSDSESDSGSSRGSSRSSRSTSPSTAPSNGNSPRGHHRGGKGGRRGRGRSRSRSRRRDGKYYGVRQHARHEPAQIFRNPGPGFGEGGIMMMSPESPPPPPMPLQPGMPMPLPQHDRIQNAYDRGRQDLAEQIALQSGRPAARPRPRIVQSGGRRIAPGVHAVRIDHPEDFRRRGSFVYDDDDEDEALGMDRLSVDDYDSDVRLEGDQQHRVYVRRRQNGSILSDDPFIDHRRGRQGSDYARRDVPHFIEVSDRSPRRYMRR